MAPAVEMTKQRHIAILDRNRGITPRAVLDSQHRVYLFASETCGEAAHLLVSEMKEQCIIDGGSKLKGSQEWVMRYALTSLDVC